MHSIGQSRDDRHKVKNMFNEIIENNVYKDQKLKIKQLRLFHNAMTLNFELKI